MASTWASLFPGVDPCTIPSGPPPRGQTSNFDDPTELLKNLVIYLTVIPTVLAIIFASGRLWANLKKPTWTDGLVLVATIIAVTQNVLLVTFVKYYRHIWDVPLCWLGTQFFQLTFTYATLTSFGCLFAKTATLLVLRQIFQISKQMHIAIMIGIAINVLLYGLSIPVLSYYSTPHVGKTWDDVVVDAVMNPQIFAFKWSTGQAAVGSALDIYIFILPIPIISRLKLSTRKRMQLIAVFGTAILGIAASLISLVYRVKSLSNTDATWNAGVLMIGVQIELTVAIIVCSMPGFTGLLRTKIPDSKLASALRSLLGNFTRGSSHSTAQKCTEFDAIQPSSGQVGQNEQKAGYYDLRETRPIESAVKADTEHQVYPLRPIYDWGSARVQNGLDVEQFQAPRQVFQHNYSPRQARI
ncbi:hypothetical protein KVR01_003654 [Diaporthe batatas]|uniref:uncharacterized protein n=1 Tax=Diaporthe batatas TaxID=748121 RepID=UPI001D0573E6|nr:uncharacterized protein KVR01_003654 [Diaporthe batatas]KAG8167965.1 hypothetical protein KVR01_003654 [Diaporthe batatas]